MKEILTQDQRLIMLQALLKMPGYSGNDSILRTCLAEYGHKCSRDLIRNHLAWLQEQGLVALEDVGGLLVAVMTERGQDVAEGNTTCIGVKKPRAYA